MMNFFKNTLEIQTDLGVENTPHITARIKFNLFKQLIDNIFLNNDMREQLWDLFTKTQHTYYVFSRLANKFKYKRATMQITHDLYMNEIDDTKPSAMTILQNGSKYLFKISDLINITQSALSNSSYFFAEPYVPKNPYNNLPFSNAILYNIYDKMRRSDFTMPILFHQFYLSGFDIEQFLYDNEAIIRDVYIRNYVKKSSYETLYPDVLVMMKVMREFSTIYIHDDFPTETLVNVMRPYLELFLYGKYSHIA